MQTAKRVLLVEDDIDDQLFFVSALQRLHPPIECDIANNGREALQKITSPGKYDIIFMDLNMPIMDGYECLHKIKVHGNNNAPVVVLSTSKRPEDIERCRKLGAAMYCTKPSSLDDLFEEIKAIVTKGIAFHSTSTFTINKRTA